MSGEMKGDRLIGNGIVLEFRKFKDGLALYKKIQIFERNRK